MDGRTDPRRKQAAGGGKAGRRNQSQRKKSSSERGPSEKVEEKVCSLWTFTVPSDPGKLPANTQVKLSFLLTSVGTDVL